MAKLEPVGTIARLLNMTERRVQQLARDNVLPRAVKGLYDPLKSIHAYIDYLKKLASGAGEISLTDERTRLTKFQADLAEIELMRARGELIPTGKAEKAWSIVIQAVRQKLLAIPTRLAARIASVRSIPQAKEILEETIREVLHECANPDLAKLARMESHPAGDDLFRASTEAEGEPVGGPEEETESGIIGGAGPVDDQES